MTMTKQTPWPPGPMNTRLIPYIDNGGVPFLADCTMQTLPKGVEIVGNGTLPFPLGVKLSGPYALAPEMAETLRECEQWSPWQASERPKFEAAREKARALLSKLEGGK